MSRLVSALALSVALHLGCGSDRPNLVIISIDTLRADHLRAYGYERDTSPIIDRLAREGTLFEKAYAPEPATVGSHATLFTGRFPYQHGNTSYAWNPLSEDEVTLAEVLSDAGYRTFAVASSVRFDRGSNFEQGFGDYESLTAPSKDRRGAAVTDRALELVDAWDPRPFFGFVHYFGPHQPYDPPEPFRSRWHEGPESLLPRGVTAFLQEHRWPEPAPDPEALSYLEARYDAEILYLDRDLSRLFEGLEERGLAEDTLVILVADHGEEFKDHGSLGHSHTLYEELLRIPLILRWPGRVPAGLRVARPVQLVDVMPTILELLEVPAEYDPSGRSLVADLSREEASAGPDLLIGQRGLKGWSITTTLAEGRFKLIAELGFKDRLFRIDVDPGEQRNLAAAHPEIVARLTEVAAARPGLIHSGEDGADQAPFPDHVRKRLEELGYLDTGP